VCVPPFLRVFVAGTSLALGVMAQLRGGPIGGAFLVAVAMALVAFRAPASAPRARGPGRWLALRADEAFVQVPSTAAWLDVGMRQGQLVMLALVLSLVAALFGAAYSGAQSPLLLAIDSVVLLPLFVTGGQGQLPPTFSSTARRLRPYWERLKGDASLRVAPWARLPTGESVADELRLFAMPRAPLRGLVGIEIGIVWRQTPAGYAPLPEVLVRVRDESDAADRLTALASVARPVPGRRSNERVYMLTPRAPGIRCTLALVRRISRDLSTPTIAASPRVTKRPLFHRWIAARLSRRPDVFVAGSG
jgi:hypothetical protein